MVFGQWRISYQLLRLQPHGAKYLQKLTETLHVVAGALGKGNTHVSYENSQVITSCPVQSIMADTDVRSSGELKRQS